MMCVIVGAGRRLAAAVYAGSKGSLLVLDCRAFGGQAGASARIENYLGFPDRHHRHGLIACLQSRPPENSGVRWPIPDEETGPGIVGTRHEGHAG